MTLPYISDEHHTSKSDANRAMATHLRWMSKKISDSAKRFTPECAPEDSLSAVKTSPLHVQDSALEEMIIAYTRQNWGKIGNISFAWGLIQLVRFGSVYYQGGK